MPAKVVFISCHAFLPPNRRGRLRAFQLWRALAALGTVHPIIVGDVSDLASRAQMRCAGAWLLPHRLAPRALLAPLAVEQSAAAPGLWEVAGIGDPPDTVITGLSEPAALVGHCLNDRRIDRILARIRAVRADMVVIGDSSLGVLAASVKALGVPVIVAPGAFESGVYAEMAASSAGAARRWCEAAALAFATAERLFAPHVDHLWVRNDADRVAFAKLVPRKKIRVVADACDIGNLTPSPDSTDLLFVGQGNPAIDDRSARQLIAVSMALDARGVVHRLRIAGRVSAAVRGAARGAPSVEVLGGLSGEVPSMAPLLPQAGLVLAPPVPGGAQPEILMAMAAGRPVLATKDAIEGLGARAGRHIAIAPGLEAFPDSIAGLLKDRAKARRIAAAGWQWVRDRHAQQDIQDVVRSGLAELGIATSASAKAGLARNIACELREEIAAFNPDTRLLTWRCRIRLPATLESLSAEMKVPGRRRVPNISADVTSAANGFFLVECAGILPDDVDPAGISIRVFAFGSEVMHRTLAATIPHERGGLVTLAREGDKLAVEGWSTADAVEVRITKAAATVAAVRAAPLSSFFKCALPVAEGASISVEPAKGLGQRLSIPSIVLREERPSSARLSALAERHRGETAWLIGNGPSVRIADLDALEGKLSFAFNRFHLSYGSTRLRPTYTVTGDQQVIEDFGQQIVDEAGGTVLVAHHSPPDLVGDYAWVRLFPAFPPIFSRAADRFVTPGGSSLFIGMQIAHFMGIRSIYLYGTDFKFDVQRTTPSNDKLRVATGEGNHFIKSYRGGRPWSPPSFKDIATSFLAARTLLSHEGGCIKNATRGGLLEIFERVPFDVALRGSTGRHG